MVTGRLRLARRAQGFARARAAGWLIAVLVVSPAAARPFAVDDLLRVEQFAQVLTDSSGRWLVIERRGAAGSAPRFDLETHKALTLGRLLVVDLSAPAAAQPLLAADPAAGYIALAFSPHGTALAVARLKGRDWELGVVDMGTRTTRWLGLTPGLAGDGRALQWLSETRLAAIVYAPGDLPVYLRAGWQTKHDLPLLWERAALGTGPTVTTVGSGRFRAVTPRRPAVRLVAIDLDRGTTRTIAAGPLVDFEAAPTGRIAVMSAGDDIAPTAAALGVGTTTQRLRLSLVDDDGAHRVTVCGPCDFAASLLRWSPSGRHLLGFARQDGTEWRTGSLVSIDARSGQMVPAGSHTVDIVIAGPPNFAPIIHADWSGETIVAYARSNAARRSSRADWFALGRRSATPLTASLTNVSPTLAAAGAAAIIVRETDRAVRIAHDGRATVLWSSPGLRVLGSTAADGGGRGRVNPGGDAAALVGWTTRQGGLTIRFPGKPARSLESDEDGTVVAAVPLRDTVVIEQIDRHGATRLLVARAGHPAEPVATINQHLESVESARAVPITQRDGTGTAVTSWLYLPAAGQQPGQRYPLVVVPYPGREFGPEAPRDQAPGAPLDSISAQVLAGAGYAVLLPGLPRTARGLDAAGLTQAVVAAVDRVGVRDDIDLSRLALWGHSFGASAAVAIAARTERFGGVIASGGLYDFVSAYGTFLPSRRLHPEDGLSVTTMAGWSETGQAQLGAPPWVDPAAYVANSPIFAAAAIHAPVLLIQGDQDIAALGQAEELFSALYRQNKDVELASYWGEGHVVASPMNLRDLYARVFAWLGATIGSGDHHAD